MAQQTIDAVCAAEKAAEQTEQQSLEQARVLVEQARAEGDRLIAEAKQQADAQKAKLLAQARQQAEQQKKKAVEEAQEEIKRLEAQVDKKKPQAIRMILKEVL